MIPMLQSASAAGRDYVMLVTDELTLPAYNFNESPLHIVGLRTKTEKLVTYGKWHGFTSRVEPKSLELEFYDYATEGGRAETANTPNDARVPALVKLLHSTLVPNELRAPLPGILQYAQAQAEVQYLKFARLIAHAGNGGSLKGWLGLGGDA